MDWLTSNKPPKQINKYWILDYSFYIYNGTYAMVRKCKCYIEATKKGDESCIVCGGKGKVYLANKDGFVTGGLYAVFEQIIQRAAEGYKIILAFDPPKGDLYRTQLLESYKGNRGEKPEYIIKQMQMGELIFPHIPKILCYTSDIHESDDVMASKALQLANAGHKVVVSSDDKDMLPLLDHKNVCIYRQKGFFTKELFIAKFGFEPRRFNEYLALCGDSADNFNLFKGLGDKAVTKIIQTHDHISHVYHDHHWKKLPDKYKKLLGDYDDKGNLIGHRTEDMDLSLKISSLADTIECIRITREADAAFVKSKLEELEMHRAANAIKILF